MKKVLLILVMLFTVRGSTDDIFKDGFEEPLAIYIIDNFCFELDDNGELVFMQCPQIFSNGFES